MDKKILSDKINKLSAELKDTIAQLYLETHPDSNIFDIDVDLAIDIKVHIYNELSDIKDIKTKVFISNKTEDML